jgi:hypothetical protein
MSRPTTKQLPRTGHGDSLCKHVSAGSCTWWCSYGRFVKVTFGLFLAIAGFGALAVIFDKSGGLDRIVNAGIAVGAYVVVMLLMIAFANRRDEGDHY